MNTKETIDAFRAIQAKRAAFTHAINVLHYDSETAMPRLGAEGAARTMGALSGESHRLLVGDECKNILLSLSDRLEELDWIARREVEELKEELNRTERISVEEFTAFSMARGAASAAWKQAKEENDFAAFLPHLQGVVDISAQMAKHTKPHMPVYDALLDQNERGLTTAILDSFFAEVRSSLLPLLRAIEQKGEQPDMLPFRCSYPVVQQRRLARVIMDALTIQRDCCSLGEVQHPFTSGFHKRDVRLTTHFHEFDLFSGLFSVAHEGGHCLYELNVADALADSPLGHGASACLHESQSRFFENMIARSWEFLSFLMPRMRELFPGQMSGITEEQFYRAANRSVPSLIRLDADELTYSMHIMIRYELEKQLFQGILSPKDLPEAWNALYRDYLGVTVPDDAHGVLQDSHWSGGLFGYFPSYSIGSAYAAQIYANMQKELDVRALVLKGELEPVVAWLTDRIYRHGKTKKSAELIQNACGGPFEPRFYIDYLTEKFSSLYGL